jgi:hypothetical protein
MMAWCTALCDVDENILKKRAEELQKEIYRSKRL